MTPALPRSLLAATAAVASLCCSGGQTGQPSSSHCDPKSPVGVDEIWSGTTPRELASAFEGAHGADLGWFAEPLDSLTQTPVDFPDAITIEVSYDGTDARRDTCGQIAIPVVLRMSTTASGFDESRPTELSVDPEAMPLLATFLFEGEQMNAWGTLVQSSPPSGTLVPLTAGAPGGRATFPAEGAGGSGAGGSGAGATAGGG